MDRDLSLIEGALKKGQAEGGRTLSRLRLGAAVCFVVSYLIIIYGFGEESLKLTFPLILVFLAISIGIWLVSRFVTSFSLISRFAIPLFDLPMIFLIQLANLKNSDTPGDVALFSLAAFLFLVALSSYSLRTVQVVASAVVATVCFLYLLHAADGDHISYLTGPVLIFLTAWVSGGIPIRAVRIISEAARQESHRNQLALYFSPGIADVIEEHGELGKSEKCEVTVLFCDIRGFTSMSENLDADEVVTFLNQFLSLMVEEVFRYGGTLDKYLGDGLMAYFNAPVRQSDHANRAIECALAMEAIIARSEQNQLGAIDVGVGIHSGEAVVGNIGAAHRQEFTVIGDTVNVASRIQALTKEYKRTILVSQSTERKLADQHSGWQLESVGNSKIRGREEPVDLFSPKVTEH